MLKAAIFCRSWRLDMCRSWKISDSEINYSTCMSLVFNKLCNLFKHLTLSLLTSLLTHIQHILAYVTSLLTCQQKHILWIYQYSNETHYTTLKSSTHFQQQLHTNLLFQNIFSILHGLVLLQEPVLLLLPSFAFLCKGDRDIASSPLVAQVTQFLTCWQVTTSRTRWRWAFLRSKHVIWAARAV